MPLIAWIAPAMASRRVLDVACLRSSLAMPLSHDNVFHTVLGLLDVTTPTYRIALDGFAVCRKAKPS